MTVSGKHRRDPENLDKPIGGLSSGHGDRLPLLRSTQRGEGRRRPLPRENRHSAPALIKWEIPRLCRGGSSRLTFPGVFMRGSIDEARDREPQKHTTSEFHQWTRLVDKTPHRETRARRGRTQGGLWPVRLCPFSGHGWLVRPPLAPHWTDPQTGGGGCEQPFAGSVLRLTELPGCASLTDSKRTIGTCRAFLEDIASWSCRRPSAACSPSR